VSNPCNSQFFDAKNCHDLSKTGSLLPAACFIGVSLVGCDRQAAVALMTVGTMFIAGMYCGFLTNHVDIAPNYAGTLMALTNTAATIPGFIVPAFVGQLTHGNVSHFVGCVFNYSSDL
jgi:ACS family sodium-dependent inorganic phosphate cotransporter